VGLADLGELLLLPWCRGALARRRAADAMVGGRKLEPEGAPHTDRRLYAGAAAVGLTEALDGGEAEPDAWLRGFVPTHVRVEEAVELGRLDPGAAVLDLEADIAVPGAVAVDDAHLHRAHRPLAHVLDGVAHQVLDGAGEHARVAHDRTVVGQRG